MKKHSLKQSHPVTVHGHERRHSHPELVSGSIPVETIDAEDNMTRKGELDDA